MKNTFNLPIDIDTEALTRQISDEISKRAKQEIGYRINYLFINPNRQLEHNALKKYNNNDPDISVAYTFIKDMIDKKLLDDKFQAFINSYIDDNFQKHLTEALDKAMEHKAHSMAFKSIKKDIDLNHG